MNEVSILRYILNNNAMLLPKFPGKAVVHYFSCVTITLITLFLLVPVLHKLKTSLEVCFLRDQIFTK